MGYTSRQLLQNCLGMVSLPLFFLAPGYLIAFSTNVLGFRAESGFCQLLWSITLSTAISVLWAVHPGIPLAPSVVTAGYGIAAVAALLLFLRRPRATHPQASSWDAYWKRCCLGLAFVVVYCALAPLGLHIGKGLFESAASQTDWSIRVQLVEAILRGGAHPVNPMFAFQGHTVPLHTYFYWYVLAAQIARTAHIGAQSALAASCLGAALAQIACMVLFLRYVPLVREKISRQSALLFLAMCVTGLDVIVVAIDLFRHRLRPDPQLALADHAPGFLYTFLWSPHHVAGVACCLIGLLLILTSRAQSRPQRITMGLLTGACFAAAAGASTFITAVFLLACLFILIDAAMRREWAVVETIAWGALVALLLTLPFVHFMMVSGAGSEVNSGAPVHVRPRYDAQASDIAYNAFYHMVHPSFPGQAKNLARVVRLCLDLFFLLVDLGLILFVAADRFRHDWPRRRSLSLPERSLWITFLTATFLCLFITSANRLHSANDAGYHAATVMRVVAALWSVPLLVRYFDQQQPWSRVQWVGATMFVLGLLSQATQIFENRFQVLLVDRGLVRALPVGERVPHVGMRFDQVRQAMDAAAQHTPANAIVQIYPHDRLGPALLMYSHRQLAASDDGCNLPFGGNASQCRQMVTEFNTLFGGTPMYHGAPPVEPRLWFDPSRTTAADFNRVCLENHLDAIVADYTSPAWQHPGTWIWTVQPVYANSTARVFLCPADRRQPSQNPPSGTEVH